MQTIKFKIVGFEEESGSLLVSFASDKTESSDPINYQAVAFQPAEMWPNKQSLEEIKIELAKAGVSIAKQQASKEMLNLQPERLVALQSLVGAEFQYPVSSLAEPVVEVTPLLVV